MSLTELFIRRPVLSMVVSLLILLLGAQGLMNLQVRQYPEVEETTITITTTYTGASADLIQGFISTPIAKSVSSAEGVDYVTTQSRLGVSTVSVRMRLNTDPNAALTEVTAKVQQVRAQLPRGRGSGDHEGHGPELRPHVHHLRQHGDESGAGLRIPDPRGAAALRHARRRRLGRSSAGATSPCACGSIPFASPPRRHGRRRRPGDPRQQLPRSARQDKNEYVAYRLDMQTTLQTPETFGMLPIRSNGDQLVRLRDVADVELGPESTDTIVSFNGSQGTFIGITPTPSANPLTTAAEVTKDRCDPSDLPKGMNVEIVYDVELHLGFHRGGVQDHRRSGTHRRGRDPAVPGLLPLRADPHRDDPARSSACFFLYALGYSINLLTLLAMVLAIGLVVDDAIVVLENIHRHIEEGLKPVDAAIVGMKEIFLPIVSMTITLAAVYAPIGFTRA